MIFDEHNPGQFHGHICKWKELIVGFGDEAKSALYRAQIVKNIKTGKS